MHLWDLDSMSRARPLKGGMVPKPRPLGTSFRRFRLPRDHCGSYFGQHWAKTITSGSVKVAMRNMGLFNVYRTTVTDYIKAHSLESGRQGLRAHTVLTGPFVTERTTQLGKVVCEREGIEMEAWLKRASQGTSVGRFGDPLKMGALVAILASDKTDFLTGTALAVDGGALKTVS